ncbi:hypothetical protein BX666DRAFT_2123828 [Dichotomocladium elegans]|nr:hypothetical protein BX666DRAFT_2123828 [Dichotomocladium elegans]
MRTISLVNHLKWSFSGNMNPHALVLGDVDNDGDNEFVIGNLSGDLAIFKGECGNGLPTYVCRGLGTITCIAIGDIRNSGRNSIVCINAEGHAHVFDIPRHPVVPSSTDHLSVDEYLKHGRRASETSSIQAFRRTMISPGQFGLDDSSRNEKQQIYNLQKPNLTLNVPVNVNRVLIADIDGDSLNELILARTDRILHAFQLQTFSSVDLHKGNDALSPASSSMFNAHHPRVTLQSSFSGLSGNRENVRQPTTNRNGGLDNKDKTGMLRKSMGWSKHSRTRDTKDASSDPLGQKISQPLLDEKAFLLDKGVWRFDGQITSLSVSTHPERPVEPILLVAQPGNTFTIIDCHGQRYNREFTPLSTPRTFCDNQHTPTYFGSQLALPDQLKETPQHTILSEKSRETKEEGEEEGMAITPKASASASAAAAAAAAAAAPPGPLSNLRKATQTIRTFLQRSNVAKDVPPQAEAGPENIIVNCEGKIQDVAGDEIQRSSYVVQNWPDVDGDDIIGNDNGAVATEIVIGKRLFQAGSQLEGVGGLHYDNSHVGMLSMDGKFSIYNLQSKELFEHNLFVTHKLFSLATLDISKSSSPSYSPLTAQSSVRQYSGLQTPSSSSQPRFPPSPAATAAAATAESFSASQSNVPSPAFSPSSKLSRVPTNASESDKQAIDVPSSGDYDQHQHINTTGSDSLSLSSAGRSSGNISRRGSASSGWSDGDENDREEDSDAELFVACAWNGVTYLIDWSQRVAEGGEQKIKFQLVKFAFEGRVCSFTAGTYAVSRGHNVPCLFYVDFEDQIFVYYDVHISPGPVTGFTDPLDDDVEEALERITDFEHNISTINSSLSNPSREPPANDSDNDEVMDLGDGWKGVIGGDFKFDIGASECDQAHDIDLADFIHECLYGFEDMKEKLEDQILQASFWGKVMDLNLMCKTKHKVEAKRLKHHFPAGMDIRRLSDLNITIEPPLERELDAESHVDEDEDEMHSSRASSIAGHEWISEPLEFLEDERRPS